MWSRGGRGYSGIRTDGHGTPRLIKQGFGSLEKWGGMGGNGGEGGNGGLCLCLCLCLAICRRRLSARPVGVLTLSASRPMYPCADSGPLADPPPGYRSFLLSPVHDSCVAAPAALNVDHGFCLGHIFFVCHRVTGCLANVMGGEKWGGMGGNEGK